jgi:DDE superfamily endonuclease
MLVLDRHKSYINTEFDQYYKETKIIPLFLPARSSHLIQPLDIGVFSPLKMAYGAEISHLARANITHIVKDDFFPAFHAAF